VQFRGRNYVVDVGAGPANAVEEFERTPAAHVTSLYPASPDHLLYVVSIEHQGTLVHTGEFPAYLTHLTLLMNGVVTARCERLLHERGTQVFWSDLVPRTRAVG
jgi:hypothetical protein